MRTRSCTSRVLLCPCGTIPRIVVQTPDLSPPIKAVADAVIVMFQGHLFPLKSPKGQPPLVALSGFCSLPFHVPWGVPRVFFARTLSRAPYHVPYAVRVFTLNSEPTVQLNLVCPVGLPFLTGLSCCYDTVVASPFEERYVFSGSEQQYEHPIERAQRQ